MHPRFWTMHHARWLPIHAEIEARRRTDRGFAAAYDGLSQIGAVTCRARDGSLCWYLP